MNIKELLLPLSLALLVTMVVQYYLGRKVAPTNEQAPVSGQMFEVKHDPAAVSPLVWDLKIEQGDAEREKRAVRVGVNTDHTRYVFSGAGAAIEQIQCKQLTADRWLTALDAKTAQEKALMVALNDKTPYWFDLADYKTEKDTTIIVFKAAFDGGILEKRFVVYKQMPKVDLTINLTLTKQAAEPQRLRVFYSSPVGVGSEKVADIRTFINDACNPQSLTLFSKITEVVHKAWGRPTAFGMTDRLFVNAMISDPNTFVYRCAVENIEDRYLLAQLEGARTAQGGSWTMSFYFGPKQVAAMRAVDPRLADVLDYGILAPFAKGLLAILNFLYGYVRNYGIAIILLTLLIKLLLLPLSIKGQRGMEKQMEMQRKIAYLKQKYRNDPERFREEQAELIKEHGLGGMTGGCLPILLQLPVFFALSRALSGSFEMYQAPFLWIPNLAAPDPWYILPVLSGASVVLNMMVMPGTQQATRQQFTSYAMALLIGAATVAFPAGLALYILVSTFLGIVQVKLLNKLL